MGSEEKITTLNGNLYFQIFVSGANKILENQKLLNKINVYPVPDADTGTNLASTLRAVIDNARPSDSYKVTANSIAVAALNGARGNSGVIFAQFLYGMSIEAADSIHITIDDFVESIKRSVSYIYSAIANPVEGTMLTVIREWADFIYEQKGEIDDFKHLFKHSYEIALKSLSETTFKLKALTLANVVDAGAKGFVLFLEGIIEGFRKTLLHEEIIARHDEIDQTALGNIIHEESKYRFCTEAMIHGKNIDHKEVKALIADMGDSLVIAGSDKMVRLHMHTDEPHIVLEKLRKFGKIHYQKADDMKKQQEAMYSRKWKIALVTDSTSDLSADLMEKYQIFMVPLNVHFGETQYIDKVTLQPDQFYKLEQTEKVNPSTSQPNESSFLNIYSHLASHYDSIISVHVSETFSGTIRNSRNAATRISKESGKTISVIDSRQVSGPLGLLTLRVAQAIESGMEHDEIIKNAEEWKKKAKVYVSVKTLKYMIRGGRVSRTKGFVASLFNILPIISITEDGKSVLFDKAFSQKANMKKVLVHTREFLKGRKIRDYIILHAEDEENASWMTKEMENMTGIRPVSVVSISPTVGVNAGKGTVALAIMAE
jgi:DegV family protein with EDD domain